MIGKEAINIWECNYKLSGMKQYAIRNAEINNPEAM